MWWIPTGTRHEGPKLQPEGFPTADQGFSSIESTLFGFYDIKIVFDAWILPSRVVDPSKKVQDLNCEVRDLFIRGSGSQIRGAGSEIRHLLFEIHCL